DQDRAHARVREAALEREVHDLGAVTAVAVARLADPDVDRAETLGDVAPVVALLARRVDDLHEADRPAVELRDQLLDERRLRGELGLPVPPTVGIARANVRVAVPALERRAICRRRGAERDHRRGLVRPESLYSPTSVRLEG